MHVYGRAHVCDYWNPQRCTATDDGDDQSDAALPPGNPLLSRPALADSDDLTSALCASMRFFWAYFPRAVEVRFDLSHPEPELPSESNARESSLLAHVVQPVFADLQQFAHFVWSQECQTLSYALRDRAAFVLVIRHDGNCDGPDASMQPLPQFQVGGPAFLQRTTMIIP